MAGGKSTPKKDKKLKVSGGESVKLGQLLVRGIDRYKAGHNVKGVGTLYAMCAGKVYFSTKRTPKGLPKRYINIKPETAA
jgi:ribosomal protein L27